MKKIICIDFDGVIHSYKSGWKGARCIPDTPVDGAIRWLFEMANNTSYSIQIYSSRSCYWGGRRAMRNWIENEFIKIYGVGADRSDTISLIEFPKHKPPAFLTIDDRAIQFNGSFPNQDEIDNFRTWQNQEV